MPIDLKELIPKEKIDELLGKYKKLCEKRDKLMAQLRSLNADIAELERILVAVGAVEKPTAPVTTAVRGEKVKAVVDYILGLGSGAEFRFSDVIKATGMARGTVYQAVQKLLADGRVEKIAKGIYKVK